MPWPDHFSISEKSRQLFIDQEQLYALETNQIVQVGYAYARENFDISRRYSEKQIVLFSIRGEGEISTPDCTQSLRDNQVAYIPPFAPHRINLRGEKWDFCWISVEPDSEWKHRLPSQLTFRESANAELVKQIIDCIHHSQVAVYPLADQLLALQVEQLRLLVNHMLPSSVTSNQIRLERVFRRVQQQLHKDWSVDELAQLHPCSEPHFHRLCQTYLGHSPIAHLTKLRMEQAARFLSTSDMSIQQICEAVGYPNPANFSTRFKKWSTLTPREYRKRFVQ
ncbi:helix-turn-helix domain-containing protein [Thaumasiovibrio subtropicus]|uniref:helix-turn-helix domain-containing protein n=1 Tax=Thaumasiovibrio subtropicus TaxID=1891207 RepID=UPI000B35504C|nr:AraC family transcriptional regulator [Thaumasiovibrio subtropicus]